MFLYPLPMNSLWDPPETSTYKWLAAQHALTGTQTKWFQRVLLICIKINLALNNLQYLMYHENQTKLNYQKITFEKKDFYFNKKYYVFSEDPNKVS